MLTRNTFRILGPALLSLISPLARAQCNRWLGPVSMEYPGLAGIVTCATHFDPDGNGPLPELFVVGCVSPGGIWAWDGSSWMPLGTAFWSQASVNALCVFRGELFAMGAFYLPAGGAQSVVRLAGGTWVPLAGAPNSYVFAATVFNDQLIVGGSFQSAGGLEAVNAAAWDGANWSAVGYAPGINIRALHVHAGTLYAGGANGSFNNFGRLVGGKWVPAGGGNANEVYSLATHGDSVVFGSHGSVVAFNGNTQTVLTQSVDGDIWSLQSIDGVLYAGGTFTKSGTTTLNSIAKWNGTTWSGIDTGVSSSNPYVYVIDKFGDDIIVAGNFSTIGPWPVSHIARTDGNTWIPQAHSANDTVYSIVSSDSAPWIGGRFLKVNGVSAHFLASWQDGAWRTVSYTKSGAIGALARIAESIYTGVRPTVLTPIAQFWSGGVWTSISPDLSASPSVSVNAIQQFDGGVAFGGVFSSAGPLLVGNIALWKNGAWSALGLGMNNAVKALAVFDGQLIAGGSFLSSQSSTPYLARWTPGGWQPFQSSPNAEVRALMTDGNRLYAGGVFGQVGTTTVLRVAVWDGQTWSAMGGGVSAAVNCIAKYGNEIVVGGDFTSAGGTPADHLASWNGTDWSALGSGIAYPGSTPQVYALGVVGPELWVGGTFRYAGGKPSMNIARYNRSGAPWFVSQPRPAIAACGDSATFGALPGDDSSTLAFQWRKDGHSLTDGWTETGSTMSGATTKELRVGNVTAGDAGSYDCMVSSSCGTALSNSATLVVSASCCPSDLNHDGVVDDADFVIFVVAYDILDCADPAMPAGCPADLNGDALVDDSDFVQFVAAYNELLCP